MINLESKIWKSFLLIILGFFLIYKIYASFNKWSIFDVFILFGIGLISLIIFLIIVYYDYKEYKTSKSHLSFIPTFIGIMLVVLVVTTQLFVYSIDSSEILISAQFNDDIGGVSIDFRKDGTYKLTNSSVLTSSSFRGKYSINDTFIALDKEFDVIQSKYLVIRNIKLDSIESGYIYQVDSAGELIYDAVEFEINN